jgi:hypothetical protein
MSEQLVVLPASPQTAPARFEAWPDDTKTRAFELWSTFGLGSATRTEQLLAKESGEGVAVPAASTIRMWAAEEGWAAARNADLERSQGRSLRQMQASTMVAIGLAHSVMIDAMAGLLDDAPYGGAGRIKAAEAMLRLAERAGLPLVNTTPDEELVAEDTLSLADRARRMRDRIAAQNAGGG